jgi:hypothetical protein
LRIAGMAAHDMAAYDRIRAMRETSLAHGCARLAWLMRGLVSTMEGRET